MLLDDRIYFYDGSKGTMFIQSGFKDFPEALVLTYPDVVYELAKSYVDVGCDFIQTNTFGANGHTLTLNNLANRQKEIITKAFELASKAASEREGCNVVFSIGSIGKLMKPAGDMDFDEAYSLFYTMADYAFSAGARIFHLETFTDLYEMKVAVLALKDLSEQRETKLTIYATVAFEENGRTLMGNTPEECAKLLSKLGVNALGANCSFGAEKMMPIIERMARSTNLPILAKSNCGLPKNVDGQIVFEQSPEEFANECLALAKAGAQIIGGCCGTTPLHIQEMIRVLSEEQEKGILPIKRAEYVEEKVVYKNPMVCYHKEWDEDSLYDLAYDISDDDENDLVCIYGNDGKNMANAVAVLQRILKKEVIIACNNAEGYEVAIRRAPNLPNIYLTTDFDKSEMDKIIKIAEKYGVKIIEGEL